jgi:RNA polymerase sigma factor (sigma-70 family)
VEPAAPYAGRAAAATELLASHGPLLRRAARRLSICADDADDALQRASEILLTKAPALERPRLIAWMTTVTKREALAVRRSRERLLAPGRPASAEPPPDPLERARWAGPGPAERAVRSERVAEARRALATLKPHERVAIMLQAQGYSYAEICELCGWTYTKVNRLLAEGRTRLRSLPEGAPPAKRAGAAAARWLAEGPAAPGARSSVASAGRGAP